MNYRLRYILCGIFLLISGWCSAQINIKISYERVDNGYHIYAENNEYCPVSVQLDFTLKNLRVIDKKHFYVVPAKGKKILLTEVTVIQKNSAYSINYTYFANRGNHLQEEFDSDFSYDLPYQKGQGFTVYQGYNGIFSHKNKYALDFTMPIGTPIAAIRDGIVIKVIEENDKNCNTPNCQEFNNYITVYHEDGTFAEYAHIKKDGAIVNPGDTINQGAIIGYSGNVGYSTGPHLHVEVFLQKLKKRQTIKTAFLINDGQTALYLKEKNEYVKGY